jgi:hypothetical protein
VLRDLAAGGVLAIEHRKAANGGNRSNRYRLIEIDPGEVCSPGGRGGDEPKTSPPGEVQSSGDGEVAGSPKPLVNSSEREEKNESLDPMQKHFERLAEIERLTSEEKRRRRNRGL